MLSPTLNKIISYAKKTLWGPQDSGQGLWLVCHCNKKLKKNEKEKNERKEEL